MRRKRKKGRGLLLCGILSLLLAAGFAAEALWREIGTRADRNVPGALLTATAPGVGRRAPGLVLQSSNALLFDPSNGGVLYAKGAGERIYPASLTKVMTAYAALEKIENLDAPIMLIYEDYAGLYEANASMAGFVMGETVTVRDLLYAAMLPSGAEAARALARAGSGSVEAAVERMNRLAEELGMQDTHFSNVTGLHDEEHYTTVSDLALLWRAAMNNRDLMDAAGSLTYTTTPTEQHPEGLRLVSTMVPKLRMLERETPEPIIGGKTGYTEEAGLCLVSAAERGGLRRALVTVGAPGDGQSLPCNLSDAYLLYERCLPKEDGM